MNPTDAMRAAFEKDQVKRGRRNFSRAKGGYLNLDTHNDWLIWKAALESSARQPVQEPRTPMLSRKKFYPTQDSISLGNYYVKHVEAMTREGLCSKADIAEQFAWRDRLIDSLAHPVAASEPVRALHICLACKEPALTDEPNMSSEPEGIRRDQVCLNCGALFAQSKAGLRRLSVPPEAERVVQREEVLELLRSTKVLIDSGQTHNIDGVALYDALRRAQKGD